MVNYKLQKLIVLIKFLMAKTYRTLLMKNNALRIIKL